VIRRLRDRHRQLIPLIALITALALALAWFSRPHPRQDIPDTLHTRVEAR
jgi:hypothetical protein